MKIGIKYCGGCNPRYDRKYALDRYIDAHKEHSFEAAKWGEHYEVIFLICGCERTCIRNFDTVRADRYVVLYRPEDFKSIEL